MHNLKQTYGEIEISTDVMSASGHRLIQLMLEKCLQHIELSKNSIMASDIQRKSYSIYKALDIVEYLRLCLKHDDEKTKDLAGLLDSLYTYLQKNLVQANIHNDITFLDEAKKILGEIKLGWDGISG